jgi:GTP-binding protein
MTSTFATSASHGGGSGRAAKSPLGGSVRLVLAGHHTGERPAGAALPAIAVLGRSNVGKSSLLNALLGEKVARVSQTPGRTQALYWYRVNDRFDIVDCPGYGYAKAAKEKRREFSEMIDALLCRSGETPSGFPRTPSSAPVREPGVAFALLLVDGRLTPRDSDLSMAAFLEDCRVPAVVAATKWDAVKPSQRVRQLRALAAAYQNGGRSLLPVSSETGENLRELARLLSGRVAPAPSDPSQQKETT